MSMWLSFHASLAFLMSCENPYNDPYEPLQTPMTTPTNPTNPYDDPYEPL